MLTAFLLCQQKTLLEILLISTWVYICCLSKAHLLKFHQTSHCLFAPSGKSSTAYVYSTNGLQCSQWIWSVFHTAGAEAVFAKCTCLP